MLALRRGEVAHLVENVIGRQQHLGLHKGHLAILQQRRRIHNRFAGLRLGWSHQPADHGNAAGFSGNAFGGFAIAGNKRRSLHQIARRISAHREFREQDQGRARSFCLSGRVHDLGGIARKISHRGIDLSQRDLHASSVKGGCLARQEDASR